MTGRSSLSRLALPSLLRRLPERKGQPPKIDYRYPCLQLEDISPPSLRAGILTLAHTLDFVDEQPTRLTISGGLSLVLAESVARGQPEAFIMGREFAIIREDGSTHLALPPAWGQKLLDRGWTTIHPLVRYLAGALPPQSLILYAPRDDDECKVVWRVLQATYWFARGEIGGQPLPDSAW